jgi:hypothetical protein
MFRKDALFAYLAHVKENGNSIYMGVVDRRLQNQIDDLQVYLREFPSVTLGKGVYRITDILMVIPLLCEQSTVEEQQSAFSNFVTVCSYQLGLAQDLSSFVFSSLSKFLSAF